MERGKGRSVRSPVAVCLAVLAACVASACTPAPRHLVLVTVDTLRADHLGCYGSPLGLTPNIDRLAAESLRFERVYAPVPYTLPSVAALLTGRLPYEIGVASNLAELPADVPTLATRLRERGFRTGAVVSNLVLRPVSGLDTGFDVYDAELPQRELERWWAHERIGEATTDAAIAALEALVAEEAPVFLWVHYQDPHGPYRPPAEWREAQLARERAAPGGARELPLTDRSGLGGLPGYQYVAPSRDVAWYRAGYAGEIGYMDAQLGRLLDALPARLDLARTAIVFAADHGEDLGERDHWFAHGEYLTESALRVPLLIRAPGVAPGVRRDVASLLDVLPTLARLFELDLPRAVEGRDLLEPGAAGRSSEVLVATGGDETSIARAGLVEGRYKLVRSWTPDGIAQQLYALPDDTRDRSSEEAERLRVLAARLDARVDRIREGLEQPTRRELTPEERAGLRALGYLDE